MSGKRVIVLGCGFGGLAAVKELSRHPRRSLEIVAFNRTPVLYNYPILPRLLLGDLPDRQLNWPLDRLIDRDRVALHIQRVERIDFAQRCIETESQRLEFDYLVLAPGGKAIPIAQDDGFTVYYPKAARHLARLRDEVRAVCRATSPRQESAAFVVVGGGLTGIEFAVAIRALIDNTCRLYGTDARRVPVTIVEQQSRIAPHCHPRLGVALSRQLARRGIRVVTGERIERVQSHRVITSHGEHPAHRVLCCIGSKTDLRFVTAGLDSGVGLTIASTLQLRGHPHCFVIGDAAELAPLPHQETKRASHAMHQGRAVARTLLRLADGHPALPYRAPQHPTLVTLGCDQATLEYRGWCLNGRWPARLKQFLETRYL